MGAVEEPFERRGHLGSGAERVVPLVEAEIGGDDHGAVAVTTRDELVEDTGVVVLALARAVSEVVNDQQVRLAQLGEDTLERVVGEGGIEAPEEIVGANEAYSVVGQTGAHPEAGGQMRLADRGWPNEEHGLAAVEEAELAQGHDALTAERRLLGEVIVLETEDLGEVRLGEALLDRGLLARQDLGLDDTEEKRLEAELEGRGLVEVMVKVLPGVTKAQAAQVLQQAVSLLGRHGIPPKGWPPASAGRPRRSGRDADSRRGGAGASRRL